ncbi:MAG: dUTP diphosphatase [Rhodospirillaceae bacterium]|nr:dUTP diphosphatase [Rhodospirillaceae bacterium]|tara:strand:+ start:595 stop:1053 length:459 start_codon:yes stop_codon:yes gene_type:complete
MNKIPVPVIKLRNGADLPLPDYATADSAGLDLLAAIDAPKSLAPGERTLIPSGLAIALPGGYEAQVRPRSGLAHKNGITVLNSPGTIDADYRGEVGIILINHGDEPFVIERGMRIAQLVITAVSQLIWDETETLPETSRGEEGFGSTGVKNG